MGPDEREALRAAILARHRTLYAFCKASGVTKSVVLQLLAGRYPGNVERQTARIRAALADAPITGVSAGAVFAVLERVGCARCRTTDKRKCRGCRILWERQAEAVAGLIAGDGKISQNG